MIRVAVGSTDGKVVNAHFGKASQFLVFDITEKAYQFVEVRNNEPSCSNLNEPKGTFEQTLEVLNDCQCVVISQIGRPMIERLKNNGIDAHVIRDFVDDAIVALIDMIMS